MPSSETSLRICVPSLCKTNTPGGHLAWAAQLSRGSVSVHTMPIQPIERTYNFAVFHITGLARCLVHSHSMRCVQDAAVQ